MEWSWGVVGVVGLFGGRGGALPLLPSFRLIPGWSGVGVRCEKDEGMEVGRH